MVPMREFEVVVLGVCAWFCAERRLLPARLRDELAHRGEGDIEEVLTRHLESYQSELCRRLRLPPEEADSLGAAWLEFHAQWKQAHRVK